MATRQGPTGPETSFSEGPTGGTDTQTPASSAGCCFETPAGRCGDAGATYTLHGIDVELCNGHLPAVLEQNGLTEEAAS